MIIPKVRPVMNWDRFWEVWCQFYTFKDTGEDGLIVYCSRHQDTCSGCKMFQNVLEES